MGKMQRRKGQTWEREVASILSEFWPNARRGIGQSRASGEVADVDIPDLWVECKHGQKVNYRAALAQALKAEFEFRVRNFDENTPAANKPFRRSIVIAKDNNKAPVVFMQLDDFLWFMRNLPARIDEQINEKTQ